MFIIEIVNYLITPSAYVLKEAWRNKLYDLLLRSCFCLLFNHYVVIYRKYCLRATYLLLLLSPDLSDNGVIFPLVPLLSKPLVE